MTQKQKISLPDNAWSHPDQLLKLYPGDIASYRDTILMPTLLPIEKTLTDAYYGNLPVPAPNSAELARLNLLHSETAKGLFLALAALWERQLRGYLLCFAQKLEDKGLERIANGPRSIEVIQSIERLTETKIEQEGTRLAEFGLVANVCRHGIGASLKMLYEKHRDNWWDGSVEYPEDSPKLWNLQIRVADIVEFANQVQRYWEHLESQRSVPHEERDEDI